MLKYVLNIYNHINYNICGVLIEPTTGIPQGSVFGPTLFLIYINNMIKKANQLLENVTIEVFVDDKIIMPNDINCLQKAYDFFKQKVIKLDMKLNINKCELLSESQQDIITDKDNKTKITPINIAKYLGQNINERGEAATIINYSDILRIKSIIHSNTRNLSLRARIKIYNIYIKSRFQHLIPLISFSGKLEDTWKNIRKSIFMDILNFNTLPRESGTLLGLSFYNIVVKPMIKMTKKI